MANDLLLPMDIFKDKGVSEMKIGQIVDIGGWKAKCIGLIDSGKYQYGLFKNLQDNILKVCVYVGNDIEKEQNELTFVPVHCEEIKNPDSEYWENFTATFMGKFDELVDSKSSKK